MGSSRSHPEAYLVRLTSPPLPPHLCVQGQGPYTAKIKKIEADILEEMKNVQELMGAFSANTHDGRSALQALYTHELATARQGPEACMYPGIVPNVLCCFVSRPMV